MKGKTCYKLKRICINRSPSQGVAVNYNKAASVIWPYLAAMHRFTVIPEERQKTNHYLSQISAHGISADEDLWIAHGQRWILITITLQWPLQASVLIDN